VSRANTVRHVFVDSAPDRLEDGTVYVSIKYASVLHRCCCGCGHEVITPLGPTDWTLSFDGETISLDPSIGNWRLPCQSHYWIRHDRVDWADHWSRERVEASRAADRAAKGRYYRTRGAKSHPTSPVESVPTTSRFRAGVLARVAAWWRRPR
jgi:hypothetical protein